MYIINLLVWVSMSSTLSTGNWLKEGDLKHTYCIQVVGGQSGQGECSRVILRRLLRLSCSFSSSKLPIGTFFESQPSRQASEFSLSTWPGRDDGSRLQEFVTMRESVKMMRICGFLSSESFEPGLHAFRHQRVLSNISPRDWKESILC